MKRIDIHQAEHNSIQVVSPTTSVSQTFTAKHANLSAIKLEVYNPVLGGTKQYLFSLYDDQSNLLRQAHYTENNFGWGDFFRFDFLPIEDSNNHIFQFTIQSLEPDDLYKSQTTEQLASNFITVPVLSTDRYPDGSFFINDQIQSSDLGFQTYYSTTPIHIAFDALADTATRLSSDLSFSLPYFTIIFLLLIYLAKNLVKK